MHSPTPALTALPAHVRIMIHLPQDTNALLCEHRIQEWGNKAQESGWARAHVSYSAMTTPLAMHFYHLHALPASRPLPYSQIVLETLGGDGSQSRPLAPSQKEIGVAGPGYSKGGSVTSGVERRKAASRAYISCGSRPAARFFLRRIDYVPQSFPISASKSTLPRPTSADSPEPQLDLHRLYSVHHISPSMDYLLILSTGSLPDPRQSIQEPLLVIIVLTTSSVIQCTEWCCTATKEGSMRSTTAEPELCTRRRPRQPRVRQLYRLGSS
ncbi:hypothetical protein B0H13DRAFT_106238 [Mycena leptocephala]|nr:hypothetical protein B0H13DRAFT_106238 [Mycena leptocephala]